MKKNGVAWSLTSHRFGKVPSSTDRPTDRPTDFGQTRGIDLAKSVIDLSSYQRTWMRGWTGYLDGSHCQQDDRSLRHPLGSNQVWQLQINQSDY
jgi:hypothetical protein